MWALYIVIAQFLPFLATMAATQQSSLIAHHRTPNGEVESPIISLEPSLTVLWYTYYTTYTSLIGKK